MSTYIVDNDTATAESMRAVLGRDAEVLRGLDALRRVLDDGTPAEVAVLGPSVDATGALQLADRMRTSRPTLGFILVRRRVDTAVLSEALRAGVREVLDERDVTGLNAAVRRVREFTDALRQEVGAPLARDDRRRGRLITVFSAKGGVGKTTLASNVAAALADGGRREVCLVDLDLAFGDVAIVLQLFPAHTIADAVPLEDHLDRGAVEALLTAHSPGLTTLVAPVGPAARETISTALVGRLLELLTDSFDYVVVDTPPAFDDQVLQAFDRSDLLLLLATLDIPALKNLKLTLETLELLNYPRSMWRIVLNRADSKVGLAIGEVEKTLSLPVSAQIPSSRDVPASVNRGVPIVLDEPRHPVSQSIVHLAELCAAQLGNGVMAVPGQLPGEASAGHAFQAHQVDKRGLFRRRVRTS